MLSIEELIGFHNIVAWPFEDVSEGKRVDILSSLIFFFVFSAVFNKYFLFT